jgi:hypothetical protein
VQRVISPRSPRFNVELGRYLKPLEKLLYKSVGDVFGEPTILKGYNAARTAEILRMKWEKYGKPIAVSIDAKRFDQHVSTQALEWEHSIYNGHYKSKYLRMLLKKQLVNHCFGRCSDGKLKYVVRGTRMSGDMNTALGNCLIMCAMVKAYCDELHIPDYSLANNGDDCVVIMEQEHIARFMVNLQRWFNQMGFDMEVEVPVTEFEEIDFCQAHPVFGGDGFVMVRNPSISLSKDAIAVKPLHNAKIYNRWVGTVGDGGLALTGGIPVVQEYYQALRRASKGARRLEGEPTLESGMMIMAKGMHRDYREPDWRTRVSFYKAFGIMPDDQRKLESYYRSFTPAFVHVEEYANDEVVMLPTMGSPV